jgi:hypothetical protein
LAEEADLSNKSQAALKSCERTIQSALDHSVSIGATIATNLRNSFALAAGFATKQKSVVVSFADISLSKQYFVLL